MVQREIVAFEDFLSFPKKVFVLIGWNPFETSRWKLIVRSLFMLISNFYIVFGVFLQLTYCFAMIGQPNAVLEITKTIPIPGC